MGKNRTLLVGVHPEWNILKWNIEDLSVHFTSLKEKDVQKYAQCLVCMFGGFFWVTDKWLTILLTVWGSNRTHAKVLPCSALYLVKNVDTLIQENT